MQTKEYKCSFSCGPTLVDPQSLHIYSEQFSYTESEPDLLNIYENSQKIINNLLNSDDYSVLIQSGSSSVSIWGSFKSILKGKDKVLVIKTGYYSSKLSEMLKLLGHDVRDVDFQVESSDFEEVRKSVSDFHPKMIVATHCETGSGLLIPIQEIGKISKEFNSIFLVDCISTFGGMDIRLKDWNIDVAILGTHKCLNLPPNIGISVVNQKTMDEIQQVQYQGYDSLFLLSNSLKRNQFPHSYDWRILSALNSRVRHIEKSKQEIYEHHLDVSKKLRSRLKEIGLKLLIEDEKNTAPIVTAVKLPEKVSWNELNVKLREKGVLFSSGKGESQVFRIGHMGIQSNMDHLLSSVQILENILKENFEGK